jgi:hypothetical protein
LSDGTYGKLRNAEGRGLDVRVLGGKDVVRRALISGVGRTFGKFAIFGRGHPAANTPF